MRYLSRPTYQNRAKAYKDILEKKGLKRIVQYATPRMKHLTPSQIAKLNRLTHVWRVGDRYYKLAHKHYGDPKYWWVIAWYNRKPTESHVALAEVIYIPTPLEDVLRFLGV